MNYEMTKNKILSPPARVCVGGGQQTPKAYQQTKHYKSVNA